MKKKEEERKPDLAGPNLDEVEERIKAMLEPESKAKTAKAKPKTNPKKEIPSAPELPDEKTPSEKSIKLNVIDAGESEPIGEDSVKVVNLDESSKEAGKSLLEDPTSEDKPDEAAASVPEAGTAIEEPVTSEMPESETDTASVDETLNDDVTAKAVEDIVAAESDELLAAEDKGRAGDDKAKKAGLGAKLRNLLSAWWSNPKAKRLTVVAAFLLLAIVLAVPQSRYFLLNNVGIRGSASVMVVDQSTLQPLRNVNVSLGGQSVRTDASGEARLTKVKLGPSDLVVERRAFAVTRKRVTVGWGSNPMGEFQLIPTGVQYAFSVSDYLSGKPVHKAEVENDDASAFSDEEGKVKLTLEDSGLSEIEIIINAEGYRTEVLTVNADSKEEHSISMVPGLRHVFVSNRSGKYDVYKVDADGKNEERILAGTGSERNDMVLLPHRSKNLAALVSTRDNKRNSDGYLLSSLTAINLETNESTAIAESERIQIIDWVGDELVYMRVSAGTSAANPNRHRLVSYNVEDETSKEIASSNFFNAVAVAAGKVYYAPSSAYQPAGVTKFYTKNLETDDSQTVVQREVWSIFRSGYESLEISAQNRWYRYGLANGQISELEGQPASLVNRMYVDSPDGKHSLWVDMRDGKGALLVYQTESEEERMLLTKSGLKYPVRWLNNSSLVYRIGTADETADYVMSLDGGEPRKLRDVTAAGSFDQWYYY
jgi:hypothetical protein